jgi:hypothetical protein
MQPPARPHCCLFDQQRLTQARQLFEQPVGKLQSALELGQLIGKHESLFLQAGKLKSLFRQAEKFESLSWQAGKLESALQLGQLIGKLESLSRQAGKLESVSQQAGNLESLFQQADKLESALQLQKGVFAGVSSAAAAWKCIAVFIAGITVITAITVQAIIGGTLRLSSSSLLMEVCRQ